LPSRHFARQPCAALLYLCLWVIFQTSTSKISHEVGNYYVPTNKSTLHR
jgi:hypothetical protein